MIAIFNVDSSDVFVMDATTATAADLASVAAELAEEAGMDLPYVDVRFVAQTFEQHQREARRRRLGAVMEATA